ncbi:phage tail protein [Citrobacter portucalensis]|uniref:phage tail protein n=1 Tax=Citrobacter portucalensis TaxID=1639133 RepID=UPI003B27139F
MSAKFYTLLTDIGAAKLASAAALGVPLKITQMAVGDGGGVLPTPSAQQTALVAEKRRAALNMLYIDPQNSSQIIAEQVIPETEGGWWIREVGLFDETGALIAVGNCPESYKPQLAEGSGRTQTVRMVLITSSTDNITLKIDPSVVLATRKYVDDKVLELRVYVDDLMAKHLAAADPHTQYATKESPTLTGTPKAPTAPAGTNTTQIASTAFVQAVVTALNNALALKAPLASPTLTGTPTAPTAAQTVNNTQVATTAFVKSAIAALVASSPAALDTLNELAAALGNDPNFATTMTNALAGKQQKDATLTNLSGKDVAGLLQYLGLSDVLKGDDATYAGFENGNVNVPYLRHKPTSAVVHLAKEDDLDDLQPLDNTLTAISGKTSAEVLEWLGMGDGHGRLLGVKVFTVSGTYTPDPLMKSCRVRAIGGGGGSGSAANTASGEISVSGGGAAGSYAEAIFTRSQIGASIAATVGAPGTGGVNSNGGTGGATALGGVLYCPGGSGSPEGGAASQSSSYLAMPGNPGAPSTTSGTALILQCGEAGHTGMSIGNLVLSGSGGSSPIGAGGALAGFSATGKVGSGYGSGAGGVATQATQSNPGARGGQGVIIIEEYS